MSSLATRPSVVKVSEWIDDPQSPSSVTRPLSVDFLFPVRHNQRQLLTAVKRVGNLHTAVNRVAGYVQELADLSEISEDDKAYLGTTALGRHFRRSLLATVKAVRLAGKPIPGRGATRSVSGLLTLMKTARTACHAAMLLHADRMGDCECQGCREVEILDFNLAMLAKELACHANFEVELD